MVQTMTPLALLLCGLDQAFDKKSWHGTNLRGSIRGLDLATVCFRPGPERKNIWEQVVHAAYWKYVVRRRLLEEKKGSFPLKGSNWIPRPQEETIAAWQADVALLEEAHRSLRSAIAGLTEEQLGITPPDSKVSNLDLIQGITAHDLYHTGQIQLLKRLASTP